MADMFECSNNLAPLGSARGALGFAQTVRRAKPRREIQCIYLHPSASLGVQPSALIGVQCSAPLKLFVERSRDEKSNAYTSTPRLRSGCNPRLRSGCNPRLRSNCSSSEAETRNPMHIPPPLGFARGALGFARGALGFARGALGFAQTVRRAKPRREIQCIYTNPSAPLGVQPLGSARGAMLGSDWGAMLGSARGAI
jgi:hypothetical protein